VFASIENRELKIKKRQTASKILQKTAGSKLTPIGSRTPPRARARTASAAAGLGMHLLAPPRPVDEGGPPHAVNGPGANS
jgi:hypothetical protein